MIYYFVGLNPRIRVENLNSPTDKWVPSHPIVLAIFIELAAFVPFPLPKIFFGTIPANADSIESHPNT